MHHLRKLTLVLFIFCIALTNRVLHTQEASTLPYKNPGLSPQERSADLVRRMMLEEKASQMINRAQAIPRLNVAA